jgi:hypothetical protein
MNYHTFIYPRYLKARIQADVSVSTYVTALFTVGRNDRNPLVLWEMNGQANSRVAYGMIQFSDQREGNCSTWCRIETQGYHIKENKGHYKRTHNRCVHVYAVLERSPPQRHKAAGWPDIVETAVMAHNNVCMHLIINS